MQFRKSKSCQNHLELYLWLPHYVLLKRFFFLLSAIAQYTSSFLTSKTMFCTYDGIKQQKYKFYFLPTQSDLKAGTKWILRAGHKKYRTPWRVIVYTGFRLKNIRFLNLITESYSDILCCLNFGAFLAPYQMSA